MGLKVEFDKDGCKMNNVHGPVYVPSHSCVLGTCKMGGIIFIMSFMSNCWPFLVNMAPPDIGETQCVCPWLGHVLPSIIC
jgi:hypothetical protein